MVSTLLTEWEPRDAWKLMEDRKHGRSLAMLLTSLYYRWKRAIPRRLRLAMRQVHAAVIMRNCENSWPIQESAGDTPDGWPGWPENKRFALLLTHDVESRSGLERVKRVAELEMELGFRSSFNFVPEGEYSVPQDLLDWLISHGFEVGVHDLHHDGSLYSSREGFSNKASRINYYLKQWNAVGFRSGFMFHNLNWAHELDVLYDASTFDTDPFEPQPDGVNTIFPFWVPASAEYDEAESGGSKRSGYVELPYTLAQDSTLFLLLKEKTIDIWLKKLNWIASKGGMALLNIHPDYADFEDGRGEQGEIPVKHYRDLLEYVTTHYRGQYWHALPCAAANYCTEWFRTGSQS